MVAVAPPGRALAELAITSANIRTEVADAADATVAWSLLDQYEPEVLILLAGTNPVMRRLDRWRPRELVSKARLYEAAGVSSRSHSA